MLQSNQSGGLITYLSYLVQQCMWSLQLCMTCLLVLAGGADDLRSEITFKPIWFMHHLLLLPHEMVLLQAAVEAIWCKYTFYLFPFWCDGSGACHVHVPSACSRTGTSCSWFRAYDIGHLPSATYDSVTLWHKVNLKWVFLQY